MLLTCTQDTARSLSHNSAAGTTPGQSTAEAGKQTDRQMRGRVGASATAPGTLVKISQQGGSGGRGDGGWVVGAGDHEAFPLLTWLAGHVESLRGSLLTPPLCPMAPRLCPLRRLPGSPKSVSPQTLTHDGLASPSAQPWLREHIQSSSSVCVGAHNVLPPREAPAPPRSPPDLLCGGRGRGFTWLGPPASAGMAAPPLLGLLPEQPLPRESHPSRLPTFAQCSIRATQATTVTHSTATS